MAAPDSLPVRLATFQRRRMYERFLDRLSIDVTDTVLDVGVTSDRSYSSSNYLETWLPRKDRITAIGLDDAAFLEALYPGLRFVRGNGLLLPFRDGAFDVVHASAVIEHVGALDQQTTLIAECARVCRKGFFITTPNRWFPVEFHTVLPLVHWLPKSVFRRLMRISGRSFFAEEENLNLMTRRELEQAASSAMKAVGRSFACQVETIPLGGWPSNLLLIGTAATESA